MERRVKGIFMVAVGVTLLTPSVSTADAPPLGILTVRLSQLRSNGGQVGCMLFGSAAGFPTDPLAAAQKRWCPINNKTSTCSFDPIPAGTYAVACFHDENKNGKLDMNEMGIPVEGYGHSNNPAKRPGPPNFDETKFKLSNPGTSIEIRLNYWM